MAIVADGESVEDNAGQPCAQLSDAEGSSLSCTERIIQHIWRSVRVHCTLLPGPWGGGAMQSPRGGAVQGPRAGAMQGPRVVLGHDVAVVL